MKKKSLTLVAALMAALGILTAPSQGQVINYHVGWDRLETLASGTYAGLPNPNYQRLTFLRFNDLEVSDPATSHWHSLGVYSYTGPAATPLVQSTSANNRIPELHTGFDPLPLLAGSGVFAGKLVSGVPNASPQSHDHYDRLAMRSVQELAGAPAGSTEHYLYNSSAGRWNQPLGASARVALQLVDRTAGLNIATESGAPILADISDAYELGQGDAWAFTPVFWVDGNSAPGDFSASFKLVDLSGGHAESGVFHIDFAVVPEPSGLGLATGALGLLAWRRRRGC